MALGGDRRGQPQSATKYACQIEKDERFWIVACLMHYYHSPNRVPALSGLMKQAFGEAPAVLGAGSWDEVLAGELHLYFEPNLPSPPPYKKWLGDNIKERHPIPYVLYASCKRGCDERRENLEGPTHVDAMLLNSTTGFAVLFEAKVLSDISYQVSFDTMRNQVARNVDVMLERNDLPWPLSTRDPEKTFFALLTPRIFKENPSSRLYGWLMNEYRDRPDALGRDLEHRSDINWADVSSRIGWLTWEDCHEILPGACSWLEGAEKLLPTL